MIPAYIVGGGFVGFAVLMAGICKIIVTKELEQRRLRRQAQNQRQCQQA